METLEIQNLIQHAETAREHSYSPYSGYMVGAALLTDTGQIVTGCNIENAAYGPSNCAERTAFFKAVSDGVLHFRAIAIVGGKRNGKRDYAHPCGVCRQVMAEFCNPETFWIIVAKNQEEYKVYTLKELLPESFGSDNLS
ncbi:MAG: cytidine deaminase [Lachnospiraceae bacterium]|nr:cytidine deaminase [Lachnospiraceae bacterium]